MFKAGKRLISYVLVGIMLVMCLQVSAFADEANLGTEEPTVSSDIVIDVTNPLSVSDAENIKKGAYWQLKDSTTEKCMIFPDNCQNGYAEYKFTVAEAGRYTVNVGAMSWAGDAYIGAAIDGGTVSSSKIAVEDSNKKFDNVPITVVTNVSLAAGEHTLKISAESIRKMFVDSAALKKAETKIDGETVISALAYDSDFSTGVAEDNYYKANYRRCLMIGQANNEYATYKINVSADAAGRYMLGVCFDSWSENSAINLTVDGVNVGTVKATASQDSNKLKYHDVGQVNLTVGEHIIKVTNTGGTHAHLQEIILTNPVNNIDGTTTFSALNYLSATPYDSETEKGVKIDTHWKTGENYVFFSGHDKNEITYKINVAEGKGGRYRVKATTWSYNGKQNLYMNADADKTNLCAGKVGSDGTVNVDASKRVFPVIDMGNIQLTSGEHTLNFYGTGCHGIYIKEFKLEYIENDEIVNSVPAEGAVISALDYASKSGNVIQITDWSNYDKLSMRFDGGFDTSHNELIYNIDIAQAGEYNVGVVLTGWSVYEPYTIIWADGKMLGYVQAEKNGTQFSVSNLYVRSNYFTAGRHTIKLENDWGTNTFLGELVIEPVPETDITPKSVTYNRASGAEKGFAEGTVTVTPPETDYEKISAYHLYWGDADGKLDNYAAFGVVLADKTDKTKAVTYDIPKGIMIPSGTTKILAVAAKKTATDANGVVNENILESSCYASCDINTADVLTIDPSKKLFSFQIMSDQHVKTSVNQQYSVYTGYAFNDIADNEADSLGVFSVGDNVDDGMVEDQYVVLKEFYDTTLKTKNIPYYMIPGNHDKTGSPSNYADAKNLFKKYANEFSNDADFVGDNLYWSKKVGNAYFIGLASEENTVSYDPTEAQLAWLEAELDKAEAEGVPAFVFCHQPIKSTVAGSYPLRRKDSGANADEIEPTAEAKLRELFASHKNALLFTGHSHTKAYSLDSAYVFGDDNYARCINVPNTGVRYGGSYRQEVILAVDEEYNRHFTNSGYNGVGYDQNGQKVENSIADRKWDSYVNYYTNMPLGFYVDVYPEYIVLKGKSFDTFEWVGSAQYLVPTDYSQFSAIVKDNILEIAPNTNYTSDEAYNVYVAMYNGDVLNDAKTYTSADFSEGKITVDLSAYAGCKVKVYTWTDDLTPLRNALSVK